MDEDGISEPCSTLTDGEIEVAAKRATSDLGAKPTQQKFDDMRQEALRRRFMKESPFFAKKHVITHTRGINEKEKQNAL